VLPARLRFFLAVTLIWASLFGLGLALDDRLQGPWVLSGQTLTRLGALSLPVHDAPSALRGLSSLFLHSDALHLAGNVVSLGLIVASFPLSSLRSLALVLLLGGALGALGSAVAYSSGLSVGPSGALCAALTASLCQPARTRHKLLWLGLAAAFLVGGALSGGDQGAHVGGLLAGLALGSLCRIQLQGLRRLSQERAAARL
jgi:membrane associated rhomboid family serine protease